jgi:hypothetical protein
VAGHFPTSPPPTPRYIRLHHIPPAQGMIRQQRDSSTSLNLLHTRCAPSVRLIAQSSPSSPSTI